MRLRVGVVWRLLAVIGFVELALSFVAIGADGGVDAGWLSRAISGIAAREYCFSPASPDRAEAPNRAQGLVFTASLDRFEITRRGDSTGSCRIGLRLSRWGRGDQRWPVAPASSLALDGARVELRRGPLVEWLVNEAAGAEHGLTLVSAPGGSGPLVLEFSVDGGTVRADGTDGLHLLFVDPTGRPLARYRDLAAFDSGHVELVARMYPIARGFRIEIEDEGASYPVQVDPLLTSAQWQVQADQAGAELGLAVATAGDVNADGFSDVLVGAPYFDGGFVDEGAIFLFLGSASGPASSASWSAFGGETGARLGIAVAPAGDVNSDGYHDIVAGADGCDTGGADAGCAYVYLGAAGLPSTSPSTLLGAPQPGAAFGRFVSGVGDVDADGYSDIAVGAPGFDDPLPDEGKIFVYPGSAGGVVASPAWQLAGGLAGAEQGVVSGAGDVNGDGLSDLAVGAPGWTNGESAEGKISIHLGSPAGLSVAAWWSAESGRPGARLGASIAAAGDVNGDGFADLIAGAPLLSDPETEEGAAFVYYGAADTPTGPWIFESEIAGARAGFSVATAGDLNGDGRADVAVGHESYTGSASGEGRVVVFAGAAEGLGSVPYWSRPGGMVGARFAAVATAGDVNGDGYSDLLVGAPGFDGGETAEGAAFVFFGGGDPPAESVGWAADPELGWDRFGTVVAPAGDIDADGYYDLLVGDPYFLGGGGEPVGLAALFRGSPSGPASQPDWTAQGSVGSTFGRSLAAAGDVDGDGFGDVLVGAPESDDPLSNAGAAYLYRGSTSGLSALPAWSFTGGIANARLGSSVASAGDVNGDGYGDVAIGAPDLTANLLFAGRVLVFHGSPSGPGGSPSWIHDGDQALADFGYSLAGGGDVDADGFSDLVVGDPSYFGSYLGGKVWIFRGGPTGLSSLPQWEFEGEDAADDFGRSVASAGDVDGDGRSDLVVGASGSNIPARDAGRAYLFLSSPSGPDAVPDWTFDGPNVNAWLGWSVASAGDTNNDGYSDVIVGAPNGTRTMSYEGRAYLFLGGGSGLASEPAWDTAGGVAYRDLGLSVAGAGDVDGDGFADLLVGDPDADEIGAALVFYGGGGHGEARAIRQLRTDGVPMALLDLTREDLEFDTALLGRTAAGRGRVRLEIEIEPLGQPFDGLGLVSGAFSPTGPPGSEGSVSPLTLRATGLVLSTPYTWRARTVSDDPLFPRSPWIVMPLNAPGETDFRTWCGSAAEWYPDLDGDGSGDSAGIPLAGCVQPPGYVANALDCDDSDATVFGVPGEVLDVEAARTIGSVEFSWTSQDPVAGSGTGYDLVTGDLGALRSSGGFGAASCLADDLADTPYPDARPAPIAGEGEYLLVRAQNSCGTGSYGSAAADPDPRDALDAGGPCP